MMESSPMRIIHLCLGVLLAGWTMPAVAQPDPEVTEAERVVQARHDAFNRKDVLALVAAYAPDAVLVESEDTVHGAMALGRAYKEQFMFMPRLQVEVRERRTEGRTVVEELLYRGFPCGGTFSARVTYEVEDGRIRTETSAVLHDDVVPALYAGPAPTCFPPGLPADKP
ncbi:MAG TPA: nuclear transport factor 2 family protein [Longimicrobium sp.]|nr:nuclear transport factor 2 family protein [Longimicrobium sp.]